LLQSPSIACGRFASPSTPLSLLFHAYKESPPSETLGRAWKLTSPPAVATAQSPTATAPTAMDNSPIMSLRPRPSHHVPPLTSLPSHPSHHVPPTTFIGGSSRSVAPVVPARLGPHWVVGVCVCGKQGVRGGWTMWEMAPRCDAWRWRRHHGGGAGADGGGDGEFDGRVPGGLPGGGLSIYLSLSNKQHDRLDICQKRRE
jgi:hypothetical protein